MTLNELHRLSVAVQQAGMGPARWPTAGPLWNLIGLCSRYHAFLEVIVRRYEDANAEYQVFSRRAMEQMRESPGGTRRLTAAEIADQARWFEVTLTLHLEIESFYQFSKILLDRLADVVYLYFGEPRPSKGSSHSRLVTAAGFERLCREHAVAGDAVLPLLTDLHTRVVRHETDVIEHLLEPRSTPGTSSGPLGRAAISMGLVAPDPATSTFDTRMTEDPAALLTAIDRYITTIAGFLEANLEKSVLGTIGHREA